MRTFLGLVWREIAERRLLLLASLFLGFVPIILPWLPGIPPRFSPEEIRVAATIGLAALFGGASLLILGSTIVGRDLSEKRLGFYFSRPISSRALWLSRIAAALALVLMSVLLIVTPATVVDVGSWIEPIWEGESGKAWPILGLGERHLLSHFADGRPPYPATPERFPPASHVVYGCMTILLLLVLVHAVSTMVRGRNLWVLADLGGLAVVLGLCWNARDVLVREQALGALVWSERLLVPAILAVLVVAGGVQLACGRIDLLRGHRYLSAILWPSLIVVALAFGAYSRWVASSTIHDLESLTRFRVAPGEQWLMAGGPVRQRAGARAAFLLETDSGRVALKGRKPIAVRLGSLSVSRAWWTFSPDGGTAVWGRCGGGTAAACELWAKDLRDAASPPRPTGIPIHLRRMRWTPGSEDTALTFNHDGTLLAVAEEARLIVYHLGRPSGATGSGHSSSATASVVAAVDARLPEAVTFLPGNQVRFHQQISASTEIMVEHGAWTQIRKLDLGTRRLVETGRLPPGHGGVRSPVRDTLFYRRPPPHGPGLYDGESGVPLIEIESRGDSMFGWGRFLADGRLIAGHWSRHTPGRRGGELTLLVLSPEGQQLHRIERAGVRSRRAGGELSPGRLLIGLREEPRPGPAALHQLDVLPRPGWTTYVLDADAGELSPLVAGVLPLGRSGTSAERLFLAGGDQIIRWNVETGESRTILPVE